VSLKTGAHDEQAALAKFAAYGCAFECVKGNSNSYDNYEKERQQKLKK
jgi:hypothetical protein